MRTGKRFVHGLVIGISIFICISGAFATSPNPAYVYSILYNFADGTGDGFQPYGSLTLSGSTLYGLTFGGPQPLPPQPTYAGTLFKINVDGTGYQILHSFAGSDTKDGTDPKGSLTLSGSTLYGFTTAGGGPGDFNIGGSVFKINTDGTGYQRLYGFMSNTDNLRHPVGAPVILGSILYGMTSNEGIAGLNSNGAIFQINTDGSGCQTLHSFGGKPLDGAMPYGSLTLVGSKLYGMTRYGGSFGASVGGYGVIFSMNLDGSGYQVMHNFAGQPNDGNNPQGSLALVGAKLYGMTTSGGKNNGPGLLFSINPDGTGYQVLLDFADVNLSDPHGALTFFDSKLYGMTHGGGPNTSGAVFQINTDGTGFKPLHYFNSFAGDGAGPFGNVTLVGSTLYGMTYGGGSYGEGVIFSCQTPRLVSGMLQLLLLQ